MAPSPPGFRFYPTEEELISFYLHHKLESRDQHHSAEIALHIDRVIPVLDIYLHNPWDLPQLSADRDTASLEEGEEQQWFFFRRMKEREGRGGRPKRVAGCGYWKATGSLGYVDSSSSSSSRSDHQRRSCIGEKRTMVFYKGKAPRGRKTHWKIHEYKAFINPQHQQSPSNLTLRHEYSLIRLYKKSRCLRSFDRRPVGIFQLQPNISTSTTTTTTSTSTAHSHTNHQLLNITTTSTPDQQADGDDAAATMMPADNHRHPRQPSGFWGYLQDLDKHFNGDT